MMKMFHSLANTRAQQALTQLAVPEWAVRLQSAQLAKLDITATGTTAPRLPVQRVISVQRAQSGPLSSHACQARKTI